MKNYKIFNIINKILSVIKKSGFSLFWFAFLISLFGFPMLLLGVSYEKMAWTLTLLLSAFCIWFAFFKKQKSFKYLDIKFSGALVNLPNYRLVSTVSYGMIDNLLENVTNRKKYIVAIIESKLKPYSKNSQRSSHLYTYGFITVKGQTVANKLHSLTQK